MSFSNLFNLPAGPYFLSHSVGCLSKQSELSLAENFLTPWKLSGGDAWPDWLQTVDLFCASLAKLFNAKAADFCPQTNLSSAFTKWLMALPMENSQVGKRKILIHEDAFPSMGYVAQAMQQFGFELVFIPAFESAVNIQTWQRYIQKDIDCVLATHVHSNTGQVAPVEAIGQLCKQQSCYLAVDVAQSAGILPIDLHRWDVDALFGSCVKWLCGGPGAGFMWVNPNTVEQLKPIDVGWFSHSDPFEMEIKRFAYAPDAKRFWGGTPNIAPYALALGSLQTLLEIGQNTVFAHNRKLAEYFLATLDEGAMQPIDLANVGGTLCIELPASRITAISQRLKKQNCYFDTRGNVMRLSFHVYNSMQQIDLLIAAFKHNSGD
ncbi:aminotransferase class V-fold PLP-dependent enzyme [Aliiglaciecola sp. 2_MG-2023]|uniref:aminotransferase class V-fold PLP-dependent enzyme n=1 Tax=unclassified Aliiglaciecola TaxID=2593648 RepID=UPI0026E4851F|nr:MULTISPECIES: aminotransferase class V-fold PLP-dependent enzyme [unclassified Aliiglaciecola]MDO6712698.1 aminotransferase class V-fold PLP-dependent enzyme [Aliiglaciecola sp. 2_MG-2023]MDO6752917.1 aminotransferase class V-fold PLP-dependent enzyme [Aliiglaciecola sp. 1_MG-2023]